jgi:hypothetical protein
VSVHRFEDVQRRKQLEQEQQELVRRVAEMRMRKKLEEQQQREMVKRARQMKVVEMRRLKEHQKLLIHQEKLRQQEQHRQEREMRAQQILEVCSHTGHIIVGFYLMCTLQVL